MTDDEPLGRELTDSELVARGRSGDEAALGTLVRRHHEAVFRVARSITGDDDAAQDVAQDAFLKAFRALSGFREDASFRTWVLTITANEARGVLRKRKRLRESGLDDVGPVPSHDMSPADAAVISDEASRARMLLDALPEKQRMSIALRIDEGLSFREIGEVIGSSEGAARVNYFHGIRRLRESMND